MCANHIHAVVRTHRDSAGTIWSNLARATREALIGSHLIPPTHPLWATRPYKVFLYSREDVRGRIEYVYNNPIKEGSKAQHWGFVKSFPR